MDGIYAGLFPRLSSRTLMNHNPRFRREEPKTKIILEIHWEDLSMMQGKRFIIHGAIKEEEPYYAEARSKEEIKKKLNRW